AVLCRHCEREHLVPEPRGCRGRHLRRVPPDVRAARARFRRLVLLVSGRAVLQRQRNPVFRLDCPANGNLPLNGNVIKRDLSFVEGFAKGTFTVNEQVTLAGAVFYSPSVLNSGAPGTYVSGGAKFTAPSSAMPEGWGFYLSGEAGHWFLGTS